MKLFACEDFTFNLKRRGRWKDLVHIPRHQEDLDLGLKLYFISKVHFQSPFKSEMKHSDLKGMLQIFCISSFRIPTLFSP